MIAVLLFLAARQSPAITRDAYGVPHVRADRVSDAFFQAGYAVAEDRLWQMETSRRLARGRLAEVLGKSFLGSDKDIVSTGYTDDELLKQYKDLTPAAQTVIEAYARGVNAYIQTRTEFSLPEGYRQNGFKPEPWSPLDSVAICVRLLQQFGRGGAGEIRNVAALSYLQSQNAIGSHALDVFDDLAWFNDSDAIPTVSPSDDPLAHTHLKFEQPNRVATEAQLAKLPKLGLLQLMGGIRISSREESTRVAESLSSPFHTGSYCVVVGPKKSATGRPLLLSGPQMGMRVPSLVHEMSIEAPGLATVGMDVPGIPGIIVGHTKSFAWGLTSGVADTDDIFFYPTDGSNYQVGDRSRPITKLRRTIKVKGGEDVVGEQQRTVAGPVVMTGGKTLFSKRSSYWMREMETFNSWIGLWQANSADEIEGALDRATMNFNFFYATTAGDFGWRYLGLIPKRAPGVDTRFPTPGDPIYNWLGLLSSSEMPHVRNPKAGFLANWNNKPVSWWPNFDTPAWGKIFRNSALLSTLEKPLLNASDLEMSAWSIARIDEDWPFFKPYIELAKGSPGYDLMEGFDGRMMEGSLQASAFAEFKMALRQELFLSNAGSFLNPEFFNLALQPSLMLRALERKTHFNYLVDRSPKQVVEAALARVAANPPAAYHAPGFRSLDPTPIPYSNRGTYIQVIEFLKSGIYGRNVVTPGVAEFGPHSNDQAALARAWLYKPMGFGKN